MRLRTFNTSDILLLRRILSYIKPYKIKFFISFVCMLSGIAFGLMQPLIWGKLLTNLFGNNYSEVLNNILLLSMLFILQAVIGYLQSYLFSFLTNNIMYDLKRDVYKKTLELPIKAFDDMRVGDFISRLNGDVSIIANVITDQFLNTVVDLLKVIIIGIVVFSINFPLALITIICFPVSYLVFLKFGRILRKKNKELLVLNDAYFSNIQQSISCIREIKSLGIQKKTYEKFLALTSNIRNKTINLTVVNTLAQTLSQSVNFASQIAVLSAGGYLIFKGLLSMEYFIAFSSYSNQFSGSLMSITKVNSNLQQVLAALERVFGLMDNLSYSNEKCESKKVKQIKGIIKFENVSFEYTKGKPVLSKVSFDVSPNKKIAIVGNSGSGKTTIFNLLLRFYEPSSGMIMIDGINIKEFDEESLRTHISVVRQEPHLFNLSIKENFLLVNPSATAEEIREACKSAFIHDYIDSLSEKYDSIIGENGTNISVGQKQRLAIARVLIKKSKIILFDEATSSLDNESQDYIKKCIEEISKTHTVITIGHRLSTVINADEIIVVNDGKISGRGSHGSLLDKNVMYQSLYETELDVKVSGA